MSVLGCWVLGALALGSAGDDGRVVYEGRWREHPAALELIAELERAAEATSKPLPPWLLRTAPDVSVTLVDLAEPVPALTWPGALPARVDVETRDDGWACAIEMPIDPILFDPALGRLALERQIFGAACTAYAEIEGKEGDALVEASLANPFVEAMAAHWLGTLDLEIEYVVSKSLESDEAIGGLVHALVEPEDGGYGFRREGPTDLTYLVLGRLVAPRKNDKMLGLFFRTLQRPAHTFANALKKATRRTVERANDDLPTVFAAFLEKRFPASRRDAYRAVAESFASAEPKAALESLSAYDPPKLAEQPHLFFTASTLCELGLGDVGNLRQIVAAAGTTPFALDAQRRVVEVVLAEAGADAARAELDRMTERFGWIEGVAAEAEAWRARLGD